MTRRILAIDDEPAILSLLRVALSAYHVDTAHGGAAGIRALAAARYDLVLLDLRMPVVDGESVKRSMDAAGDRTPVVILSGEHDAAARARHLGAVAALGKPFKLEVLEALVGRVLGEGLTGERSASPAA